MGVGRKESFKMNFTNQESRTWCLTPYAAADSAAARSAMNEGVFVGFLSGAVLWAMMELWHRFPLYDTRRTSDYHLVTDMP